MKLRSVFVAVFMLVVMCVCGCGSNGGEGLNGTITLATPTVTGSVVKASATYTNPDSTKTNLLGVPITFSVYLGSTFLGSQTQATDSSGKATTGFFNIPSFSGSKTLTVTAKADNLVDNQSISVAGTTLTVTPPPALALTTTQASGTSLTIQIPPTAAFVTITDPFNNDLQGHTISISAAAVSTNPNDTITQPNPTTTGSTGTAPFPGSAVTLIVPALGSVETVTITWTVTDTKTNQTGTGLTTVTLTKSS